MSSALLEATVQQSWSRRTFLAKGSAAAALCTGLFPLRAQTPVDAPLLVASAGALRSMLEGTLKAGAARDLHLALSCHPGGADGVAHGIVTGEIAADVFTPITAEPMRTVLAAGKATGAVPFARTEMVLVYSPQSRFAAQFAAAAAGTTRWWQVLQMPGVQIARSDPANDPSGRATIFVLQMAERFYRQPGLAQAVLGDAANPKQILSGGDTLGKLRRGELDALLLYRSAALSTGLPLIPLPPEINLSGDDPHGMYPDLQLVLKGKTFLPEPLVFYAATLTGALNPAGAQAFVRWLRSEGAQALLQGNGFAAPGAMPVLQAAATP